MSRPHGLVDLLIILTTFGLLQFEGSIPAALRFTFVTASCLCHPPSVVVVLKDDALWIETSERRRFYASVYGGREHWRTFLEVPESARSSPATVRIDVADDVEMETLAAVIDLCREVGFTDVHVAVLSMELEQHFMRM